MADQTTFIASASAAIVGLLIVSAALLRGWTGWLEVKRLELETRARIGTAGSPQGRIEMADLKERVRKLEAIANGTD